MTRSLGRLGIPVYNIDSKAWAPAFSSRYCRGSFRWDIHRAPVQDSVAFLLDVARKIGRRPLLIPTTDTAACFVARNAAGLEDAFLFPDQPPGLVEALADKKKMYFLARKHGVPVPETAFPQSRADVLRFLQTAAFPVMLKGIDGKRLRERTGQPMYVVTGPDEMLDLYDKLEEPHAPNLMLQEYIPGAADSLWMFNGYFNAESDCLAGFTGRKLRQAPVDTGPASLGVCLRNDTVDQTTRRFMKALGYRGILDADYRYDARDGRYKILDVNPRIGCTFRLFAATGGLDVARAFYLDMNGLQTPTCRIPEGRRWIVEDSDFASCLRLRRDGKLTPRQWIESLRGVREAALFALDDPIPALRMYLRDISTPLRKWRDPVSSHAPAPLNTKCLP